VNSLRRVPKNTPDCIDSDVEFTLEPWLERTLSWTGHATSRGRRGAFFSIFGEGGGDVRGCRR